MGELRARGRQINRQTVDRPFGRAPDKLSRCGQETVRGFCVPDSATRETVGTAVLRPLQQEDAARFHQLINDWDICRRLPEAPFPYPLETAEAWVAAAVADRAAGRAHEFAILDADGSMIGSAGLRLDAARGSAALGYWIGRRFWRRGHAGAAVAELLHWGFAELPIATIEATVAADNAASIALLERAGFSPTGRGHAKFIGQPGASLPVMRYAITREALALRHLAAPEPVAAPVAAKPLVLVAACALVDIEGRILLARRPPGKKMAGLWEFPGGKLAPGETPERALVREMEEELGILLREEDVAPFAFASHAYDQFHLLMPLYLARRWSGTPEPREGQALAWVPPDRLDEYPMPPADRPLLPLLRDFL